MSIVDKPEVFDQLVERLSKLSSVEYIVVAHEGLPYKIAKIDLSRADVIIALVSDVLSKTIKYKGISSSIDWVSLGLSTGKALYIRMFNSFTLILECDREIIGQIHDIVNRFIKDKLFKCSKCGLELDSIEIKCPYCSKNIVASSIRCPYCGGCIGIRRCPKCRSRIRYNGELVRVRTKALIPGIALSTALGLALWLINPVVGYTALLAGLYFTAIISYPTST